MKGGALKGVFTVVGVFFLWGITMVLQSVARDGPDRANAVQVPLILVVLGAPLVTYFLRGRRGRLAALLAVQFAAYVAYETGISIQTNIRFDLLLIYPAILFTAWRALSAEAGRT